MRLMYSRTIELDTARCERCGKFYAHEPNTPTECPYCKSNFVRDLESEVATLKRSNAALRGARKP